MRYGLFVFLLLGLSVAASRAQPPMPLKDVRTFMEQIQGLDSRRAITRLAESQYDMLIIDLPSTQKGGEGVDMPALVHRLREGDPGRIVLAYLPFAEAETGRFYWSGKWRAPKEGRRGFPEFLLGPDPEGWEDTYVVAYWDRRWQDLLLKGPDSLLERTLAAGVDGVLLDWANGYECDVVQREAAREGIDPAKAMVDLICRIRQRTRELNPACLVIAGDSVDLIDRDPRYIESIDGLLVQGTWFRGQAGVDWGDSRGGDLANPESATNDRLRQYALYAHANKRVFAVDYCLKKENADRVYAQAMRCGVVSLVSQVSLSAMSTTPPPDLGHDERRRKGD